MGDDDNGLRIFSLARQKWADMIYPGLIKYRVSISGSVGGVVEKAIFDGENDTSSGEFRISTFSEAETANPYQPHGTSIGYSVRVGVRSGARPLGDTSDSLAISHGGAIHPNLVSKMFAIPEISPAYSFGIRPCTPKAALETSDGRSPGVIGTVSSATRRYHITFAGMEDISEISTAHIILSPLLDPGRDRLRDLWVSLSTGVVIQARIMGNFTDASTAVTSWLVSFSQIDGVTFIVSERSEGPVVRGGVIYQWLQIDFRDVMRDVRMRPLSFALPVKPTTLDTIEEAIGFSHGNSLCMQ